MTDDTFQLSDSDRRRENQDVARAWGGEGRGRSTQNSAAPPEASQKWGQVTTRGEEVPQGQPSSPAATTGHQAQSWALQVFYLGFTSRQIP